jgi:hypothetical protein
VRVGPATSNDGNYAGQPGTDVFFTNVDNDSAGITVLPSTTPSTRLTTGENGATATFTVVLNSQPTATVTIPIVSTDTTEGTVSHSSLVFTTSDWNGAKTVTIQGVDDGPQDGDPQYTVTVGPATSGDTNYQGRSGDQVYVTNVDNDTAGIAIAPITTTMTRLVTDEAGLLHPTFTVVLNAQPTADVVIPMLPTSAEGTVTPPSLTFGAGNWNTPQTVTLHGANDFVQDGDQSYEIAVGPASSGDNNYNGLPGGTVYCTNIDNDTAGFGVSPVTSPSSRLQTYESGSNATFTIVLNAQPTSTVTIPLGSTVPDEGVPCAFPSAPPSCEPFVSFTASDWSTPKTVTIFGVDDAVQDGNQNYMVTVGPATSTDPNYSARTAPDVYVVNNDNDIAAINVTPPPAPGQTAEGGGFTEFTVVLTTQPVAAVTVHFRSSAPTTEGSVNVNSLTFNPSGENPWNQAQTVRITGIDDNIDEPDQPYSILFDPTTGDGTYSALPPPATINLTNVDNDLAGIILEPLLCNTSAGSPAAFSVRLASRPTGIVTLNLTTENMARGMIAPPTVVTFTNMSGHWSTPQAFTVNAGVEAGPYGVSVAPDSLLTMDPNYTSAALTQTAACTNTP